MKSLVIASISFIFIYLMSSGLLIKEGEYHKRKQPKSLSAGMALSSWNAQRSFPGNNINMRPISEGFQQMKQQSQRTSMFQGSWAALGPMNFGGRTLAIAINPVNPNTLLAGSASGGLWKSYSGGLGATAWQQVETGFPIIGVAAIAINPLDTNEIYIGTGEVYNDQQAGTGFAVRTTRGSYGIGILKSIDGGISWSKSLDWQYDELKGVQDIIMNPLNPSTLFAATTEGTFRSLNSGQSWQLVQTSRMATDLLMMPGDTSKIFIAAGNSFSVNEGIYVSSNGGTTFTKITSGLPATYSGKAMLDICLSNNSVMYASIADQLMGFGLYRSDNGGVTWFQANPTDYQTYQGWYAHDVIVNPGDPNIVLTSGINTWKSIDGGATLSQKSYWYNWDFNATTVGGSEGSPDYVHADIHRMYYSPFNSNLIYLATDGGVFRSVDGGENFEGCNGGYHCQQFYANFSCSSTDSLFGIGGLQDNATAVYEGNAGWRRVIGGDGLSTAINPLNDQIVYGSSQYLNIEKSIDKGQNFNGLNTPAGSVTNFAGPFVLAPSNPNVLYAGSDLVYKTINAGQSWTSTNGNSPLDGNAVLVLEVSDTDPNLVFAATAPVIVPQVGLFKTSNGGTSWTNVTAGIPNRYIMDIAIEPGNNTTVFVAVSGFGTPHVFRSTNGGNSWSAFGNGLPDVPTNTITFDPINTAIIYLGNDLGVYVSIDGGQNWQVFNDGLIDGALVMDISISPVNRKLRLATHGKGLYERDMLPITITSLQEQSLKSNLNLWPNPVHEIVHLELSKASDNGEIKIFDIHGNMVKFIQNNNVKIEISLKDLKSGIYLLRVINNGNSRMIKFVKI